MEDFFCEKLHNHRIVFRFGITNLLNSLETSPEIPEDPQAEESETTITPVAKKAKTWYLPVINWVKLNEKSTLFGSLVLKIAGLVLLISLFFILRKEFLKKTM